MERAGARRPAEAVVPDSLRILVVHGPNLNLLGRREPKLYGRVGLAEIDRRLAAFAGAEGVALECFQSNHEGALVERIQQAAGTFQGIVINPGGLTHTSVVLRDALLGSGVPFVEVHLSNVHARESFRRTSLLADAALGAVAGFGAESYELGLRGLLGRLRGRRPAARTRSRSASGRPRGKSTRRSR